LLQNKTKKHLSTVLKIIIFILLVGSIYNKIAQEDFSQIVHTFWDNLFGNNLLWLLIGIALMPFNWCIEAIKWKALISKIENISLSTSLRAICAGITLAMFTPNRVGEFGGRVLLLKIANKIEGIAITLVGSFSQITASFFIGLLGWIYFYQYFLPNPSKTTLVLTILCCFLSISLFILYYRLNWLKTIVHKMPLSEKTKSYFNPIVQYNIIELSTFLGLSALRFIIFSLQYCFFFWACGVEVGLASAMMLVFSIFFVQTIIPSIAIVELGIRGKVALYFMEFVKANALAVLTAAFSLWAINLLLPAFIGLIVLIRKKDLI